MKNAVKGMSFKVILLGDHAIGKTALIQKYIHGTFREDFNVTVGAQFSSKTLLVEGNYIQLQIWDTSGQDVYRSITKSFYRGVAAVFLVYSVDNRQSFQHMQEWLDDFYQKGSRDAFVFVVGTRNDRQSIVSSQEAFQFMKKIEGAFFIETSSKQNQNVSILFQKAAESMYKLYSISPQYRNLVNFDKQSKTKGSAIGSSGISLQNYQEKIIGVADFSNYFIKIQMSLKKVDHKYLETLAKREAQLEQQVQEREEKQQQVNKLFLEHVRKQLDLLLGQKEKMVQRNELYLSQIKNYSKQFNRILPELLEAQDKLSRAKIQYQRSIQKSLK